MSNTLQDLIDQRSRGYAEGQVSAGREAARTLRPYLHHKRTCAADSFDTGLCDCGLRDRLKQLDGDHPND